jgi:hypothetical protein
MKSVLRWMLAAVAGLAIASGARSDDDPHKMPKPSTSPAFEVMKKLVGDWVSEQKDENGKQPVMSSFKLTSNGSVLHETLFPGSDHEMVTVYHMDGPDLIATHYCALGNQPRLKYQVGKDPKVLEFKSVSVGNGKSINDMHMGYAKFTLVDDNHYTAEWQGMVNQKPDAAHQMKASLTRKSK